MQGLLGDPTGRQQPVGEAQEHQAEGGDAQTDRRVVRLGRGGIHRSHAEVVDVLVGDRPVSLLGRVGGTSDQRPLVQVLTGGLGRPVGLAEEVGDGSQGGQRSRLVARLAGQHGQPQQRLDRHRGAARHGVVEKVARADDQSLVVVAGTVLSVTVVAAGSILSAAGEAIAFIPSEIGRALIYDERITR